MFNVFLIHRCLYSITLLQTTQISHLTNLEIDSISTFIEQCVQLYPTDEQINTLLLYLRLYVLYIGMSILLTGVGTPTLNRTGVRVIRWV